MIGNLVKTARVIGWARFLKTAAYLIRDRKAKEQEFYDYPEGRWSMLDETEAALRVLGLPEDWVYNEDDLRRAKTPNLATTFFAVDHLVMMYTNPSAMEMLEEERRKRLKMLPASQAKLPGARPLKRLG